MRTVLVDCRDLPAYVSCTVVYIYSMHAERRNAAPELCLLQCDQVCFIYESTGIARSIGHYRSLACSYALDSCRSRQFVQLNEMIHVNLYDY